MLRGRFKAIISAATDLDTRVKVVAVALLVVSSLFGNLSNLRALLRDVGDAQRNEQVAHHEKRLEPLKKVLPDRGVVGYASDAVGDEWDRRLYLTQYVLAPLVVVTKPGPRLVVGDFSDAEAARRGLGAHLRIQEDFGGGVVLAGDERK